jgi:SAM-dependent methyltransferase
MPTEKGIHVAFPKFWEHDYYVRREMRRIIVSILDEIKLHNSNDNKLTALDFGCGECPYESLFKERAIQLLSADLSGNALADITYENEQHVPVEDSKFDIVTSIQVLEHVPNVPFYLKECHRMLKPNGLLILSTHGTWPYHPCPTDIHRWTFAGLQLEIEKNGFVVEKLIPCMGPLAYSTHMRNHILSCYLRRIPLFSKLFLISTNIIASFIMPIEDFLTPPRWKYNNSSIYFVEAKKTL